MTAAPLHSVSGPASCVGTLADVPHKFVPYVTLASVLFVGGRVSLNIRSLDKDVDKKSTAAHCIVCGGPLCGRRPSAIPGTSLDLGA